MEAPTASMEVDSGQDSKEQLKALVHRYFAQLTKGCGRTACTNTYCGNGPQGPLPPNRAAIMALKLAETGRGNLCENVTPPPTSASSPSSLSTPTPTSISAPPSTTAPTSLSNSAPSTASIATSTSLSASTSSPAVGRTVRVDPETPHLPVDAVHALLYTAKETGEYTHMIRTIGSIFSTPEYLNLSFLKDEDINLAASEQDPGLDYDAIETFYAEIQKMPGNVNDVMTGALGRLVGSLRRSIRLLTTLESLRHIMIVLVSPYISEPSEHREITNPLCLAVTSLPEENKKILVNWIANLGPERYRQLLTNLRQYMTMRLILPSAPSPIHNDEYVAAATRIVGLLHEANDLRHYVNYTEFYNEVLDETIDIKEDFMAWRNKSGFSFCNYAFILHPATKAKVLQFESLVQQQLERQAAFHRAVFSGRPLLPFLPMKIRRPNLIQDTLTEISRHDPSDLKKELRVHFVGEEALDEGGVQKEFFQLILREIFDPKYGMFEYITEAHVYWFNSNSMDCEEFELIGIILGLAVYNSVILDLHFPFVIYKKLMNITPTLEDLKNINPGLAKGLKQLLEFDGDVRETFDQNFQITYEVFGERRVHDLKPGAENIMLTNANRQEYVNLYVEYLLVSSVERQFEAFIKGFRTVLSSPAFDLFRVEELELLICGDPVLNFEELERVTLYDNGFSKDHPFIKNFWGLVHNFTQEQRKRLLFFSTGSDRAPIGGLGKINFVISRHGPDSDRLPIAHTCFNHLLLPEYDSKEKLEKYLLTAINNAEGFGMI